MVDRTSFFSEFFYAKSRSLPRLSVVELVFQEMLNIVKYFAALVEIDVFVCFCFLKFCGTVGNTVDAKK